MSRAPLVVVGDTLLDRDVVGRVDRLCPDAPVPVVDQPREVSRPGGAGLAALLARRDGRDVVLVTALAADDAGAVLRGLLDRDGVRVVDLGLAGSTPEKVRVRAEGRSLLRLDRGGAGPEAVGPLTAAARAVLAGARGVLVADYGRGVAARLGPGGLPAGRPVVWDPHPRGGAPSGPVALATPNLTEARGFAGAVDRQGTDLAAVTLLARRLRARWGAAGVAVTLGARGALLVTDPAAPPYAVPAPAVPVADPCGAGDRFAATAAGLLADGALTSEAVTGAVGAAAAFVAAGGAAAVPPAGEPAALPGSVPAGAVVARVRAAGGTVVAAGGCFDLLHPGHVALLQAARRLGDALVVLLNSDASVRRLKGPGRPVNPAADRAAVLAALGCVDAVEVFDEPTPVEALRRLRPDVFAKGGDYALADLPESAALSEWGGQVVVLPYLAGHSTTSLLREVVDHA